VVYANRKGNPMTESKTTLALDFGALCRPIHKQLRDQGVRMTVDIRGSSAIWQKDADAITRLAVRQLLPDSAAWSARKKLLKKIIRGLEANAQRASAGRGDNDQTNNGQAS